MDNTPSKKLLTSVAPFVGAWIEINYLVLLPHCFLVAPFVGAWIEIQELS